MGADWFEEIIDIEEGYDTARTTFNRAVDDAWWHYGHAGYTGTIAEKNEFKIRNGGKPILRQYVIDFMAQDGDDNDKWGPAFCVPICDSVDEPEITGYAFYGWASS